MKKFLFSIVCVALGLISCNNKQVSDNTFDSVTLYYYGRSPIGTIYEVPVSFVKDNREEAIFTLYSFSPDLEEGVYNYNDQRIVSIAWQGSYSNMTFFKYANNKYNGIYIVGGTIDVKKENDNYTFIIDVLTEDGYWHTGKYTGKVRKQNYSTQSQVKGFFALCHFSDHTQSINPNRLPENFQGKVNFMSLMAGDINYGMQLNFIYWHIDPNNPAGVYDMRDINILQANYYNNISSSGTSAKLVDGTITITRSNISKYKVEVDVTDENGKIIKEKFDGGDFSAYNYE